MSVPNTSPRSTETRHLFRIINTVSSTLDLDRVLRAIVDLVSDAIDFHACFIYLIASDGSLVLRSVSDPYGALVNRLRFEPGEGLAGWVAQNNQPVFLTEGALTDPRAKIVPEADEEEYQSIVAVPLRSKAGEVVGVISLHAEAPREFTEADSDFLVHAASLVAGAIENARLYEHTRRRLTLVEGMADLARAVSAASALDQLLPAVVRRAQRLLGAAACEVYVSRTDGTLELGASSPVAGPRERPPSASDLGVVLARGRADEAESRRLAELLWGDATASALVAPMVAADELLGFLTLRFPGEQPADPESREVATSIAGQAAIALKNLQLIERLTEHNAIKDFLEDLSLGRAAAADLADRGRGLGCDLQSPHLVLQAAPRPGAGTQEWEDVARALESGAARAFPGRCSTAATAPSAASSGSARAVTRRRPPGCASCTPVSTRATRSRSGSRTDARVRRASPPGSRRRSTRSRPRRSSAPTPVWSASTTSAPTSTFCGFRRTAAPATTAATRSRSSRPTTAATAPSSS